MIYIIAIKHESQHNGPYSNEVLRNKLVFYLENAIKKYAISLIAEEFNEKTLTNSHATIDTAKYVADKLNVKHLFCDPNEEERKLIGIPLREEIKNTLGLKGPIFVDSLEDKQITEEQRKYYPIRENFWFEKIEQYLDEVIIFLCGSDHVESFKSLLSIKGYTVKVLVVPL